MSDEEDDEGAFSTPLQDLRPFYRSRARQDLTFVRAGIGPDASSKNASSGSRAADIYAAIVLKDQSPSGGASGNLNTRSTTTRSEVNDSSVADTTNTSDTPVVCEICQLPLAAEDTKSTPHAASLAHQVCLAHSHPPSHLDRGHVGLRYMAAQGWDPDARVGLGAEGTGIRAPIKTVAKKDTAGLGLVFPEMKKREIPVAKLDAGKVRKQYEKSRRQDAKLRELFYGDDKIAKYLGEET